MGYSGAMLWDLLADAVERRAGRYILVDLGEIFLLEVMSVSVSAKEGMDSLVHTMMIGALTCVIIFAVFSCRWALAVSVMTRL